MLDFYFEYSKNFAYGFLTFSAVWLNISIITKKYMLLNKVIKNDIICFVFRVFIVFLIAAFIDQSTTVKPIDIYTNWQTYIIFISAIFLICMPSVLFLIIKKYL